MASIAGKMCAANFISPPNQEKDVKQQFSEIHINNNEFVLADLEVM